MSNVYVFSVRVSTPDRLSSEEQQHLAYAAADAVVVAVIDDERVVLDEPVEFRYDELDGEGAE